MNFKFRMKARHEIVRDIAERYGYTVNSIDTLYTQVVDYFKEEIQNGEEFSVCGFFRVTQKYRPAREIYDLNLKKRKLSNPRVVPEITLSVALKEASTKIESSDKVEE